MCLNILYSTDILYNLSCFLNVVDDGRPDTNRETNDNENMHAKHNKILLRCISFFLLNPCIDNFTIDTNISILDVTV